MVQKMVNRILKNLEVEELNGLSKFFFDVAKGILGAPIVVYLVSGFSAIVLLGMFVISLALTIACLGLAIYLLRVSRKRIHYG